MKLIVSLLFHWLVKSMSITLSANFCHKVNLNFLSLSLRAGRVMELETIDGYEFQRIIGEGEFGRVVLATNGDENNEVAIKKIWYAGSSMEKIKKEVRFLQKLKTNPFFSTLLFFNFEADCGNLGMQYFQEGNLYNVSVFQFNLLQHKTS